MPLCVYRTEIWLLLVWRCLSWRLVGTAVPSRVRRGQSVRCRRRTGRSHTDPSDPLRAQKGPPRDERRGKIIALPGWPLGQAKHFPNPKKGLEKGTTNGTNER